MYLLIIFHIIQNNHNILVPDNAQCSMDVRYVAFDANKTFSILVSVFTTLLMVMQPIPQPICDPRIVAYILHTHLAHFPFTHSHSSRHSFHFISLFIGLTQLSHLVPKRKHRFLAKIERYRFSPAGQNDFFPILLIIL